MASASISSPCGTERLSFEARLSASTSSSSSERSLSPERERATRELERRSFLRAYSRKSLESNPEDEELVVGDDGMISVVPLDERAQLERMRQLLDKKERETRLAAEYGLSLLESNEELHLEIEALKIQHEAETAELEADRDLYRRRHELALQEVESWRSEAKRHEEAKYQLSAELEKLAGRCECVRDGRSAVQRQHQRIQELEATVAELQASETSNATVILALKKWKSMVESERKKKADLAEDESASERLYVQKLEQDTARLRFQLDVAQGEKKRLDGLVDDAEQALKAARNEIDELHGQLKATESELHAQAELLLTAESKCGRLERERAIMEQVANLPVAVFDQDDDDDDDDDDYDYDDDANNKTMSDDETKTEIEDPMSEEEWFSQKRSASVSVFHCGPRTPANAPPGHNARVPATPSSMATHQKLHHYFHLTALSIIHENNLHERCFDSSSRATIDTWYQEVVDQGVQFLEWHAWLINRIGAVAAAMQREEEALERSAASQSMNGKSPTKSHSPFRAFMRRRESSKAQESFQGSTLPTQHPYGLTPSQVPATPRVPSSVAWSFFSRLVGRRDNQDHHTDD